MFLFRRPIRNNVTNISPNNIIFNSFIFRKSHQFIQNRLYNRMQMYANHGQYLNIETNIPILNESAKHTHFSILYAFASFKKSR